MLCSGEVYSREKTYYDRVHLVENLKGVTVRTIPFGKPVIGEEEKRAVMNVLEGPILVHGPVSKLFEGDFAAFTGASHAVSVSSCTAALHLAYFDLGIGPGDEVIVPAQTHNATAHAVEFTGAKPVFVDAEMKTGNVDIEQIEQQITQNTKAISVVHFLGMPVAMDRVMEIASKHDLFVLEDCALAIGSFYKGIHVGLHGDAGCFSFYPVKHMTTAEGGMLITKHGDLAARITRKRAFGVNRTHCERDIPGVYDVNMLGYNYRMNEIQAAMGIEQLKRMDGFLKKRSANYRALEKGMREIDEITLFGSTNEEFKSSYYCLSVVLSIALKEKRFEIVNFLKENGIGTSVYYPRPVPHMTYYKEKYGYSDNSYPNAAKISYSSIALPVGPHLDSDDMEYIIETIKKAIYEVK
ncbi:MAG: DegT/DnrJ/EryC1/StrS family aminotransferase [Euryarchaeota archaeon]|nr:DegT/DnrJ/EryC1/StrS family aminotransferase [Euryarchaeota archaeon]